MEILNRDHFIEILFHAAHGQEALILRNGSETTIEDLSTLSAAVISAVYNTFLDKGMPLQAEEYRSQLLEKLSDDYFWALPIRFEHRETEERNGPLN